MEIKKVGVLGCGLMGSGIAQVCATAGFDVTVLEVEQKYLDKGFAGIEKSLAKFAERPPELLTLFALVLAIGIVVDDAIVVVEAVQLKLEHGYQSPRKAAIDAMQEITGAILSITLIMAAVFIPVTFVGGSTGVFYKQFGVTLAVARPRQLFAGSSQYLPIVSSSLSFQ